MDKEVFEIFKTGVFKSLYLKNNKAALIYFTSGKIVSEVEITALDGTILKIPIALYY